MVVVVASEWLALHPSFFLSFASTLSRDSWDEKKEEDEEEEDGSDDDDRCIVVALLRCHSWRCTLRSKKKKLAIKILNFSIHPSVRLFMPPCIHHECMHPSIIHASMHLSFMPPCIHHACIHPSIMHASMHPSFMPPCIRHACLHASIMHACIRGRSCRP